MQESTQAQIQRYLDGIGVRSPAAEFCVQVSNVYHAFESQYFDRVHDELTETSARWRECLEAIAGRLPRRIRLLDVGTGTGWACAQAIDALGPRIADVVCLDLSPDMLAQCEKRIRPLAPDARFIAGQLSSLLPFGEQFDLVLTSAMLHHVVNLDEYLHMIGRLVRPGGVYVAGNEPSADFYSNRRLYRWTQAYRIWRRGSHALRRIMSGGAASPAGAPSLEELTNDVLLQVGLIQERLPRGVIPQLVDVHVPPAHDGVPFWGEPGFSPETINNRLGATFEVVHVSTYPHLKDARARMGPLWRAIDRRLAKKYPTSGALLTTAVMKRR